ncbi:hypothetical protein [Rhodosalinus sp.]|uniref:hypothetical protein n=1 Tax=Rhodosalinus sp. TaxID=2047741 RepID=UPI003978B3FD
MRDARRQQARDARNEAPRAHEDGAVSRAAAPGAALVAVLVSGPVGLLAFIAALVGGAGLPGAIGLAFAVQLGLVVVVLLGAGLFGQPRPGPPLGAYDRPVRRPSGRGVVRAQDATETLPDVARWDVLTPRVLPADAPRVAFICSRDGRVLDHARRLAEAGHEVHLSDNADALFDALAAAPQAWSAAIVDLRAVDDDVSALDDLREHAPNLPLVALGDARDAEGPWDTAVARAAPWIALRRALHTALAARAQRLSASIRAPAAPRPGS